MQASRDEPLSRDASGDPVADLVGLSPVRMDLERQAGTGGELAPVPFGVRRVDPPLGVVSILGGDVDLATGPLLQKHVDHAMRSGAAVVIDPAGLGFIDPNGLRVLVRAEQQLPASDGQLMLSGDRGPCTESLSSPAWMVTSSGASQ